MPDLQQEYQRLLIGPDEPPALSRGFVCPDLEQMIFGDSHQKLCKFLVAQKLMLDSEQRKPSDHAGLLLLVLGQLAIEGREEEVVRLLEEFLLPWAERFVEMLIKGALHPFYSKPAELTGLTLNHWQAKRGVVPCEAKPWPKRCLSNCAMTITPAPMCVRSALSAWLTVKRSSIWNTTVAIFA